MSITTLLNDTVPRAKDFLEDRRGRPVDVVMNEGLEPLMRDRVQREAETVF